MYTDSGAALNLKQGLAEDGGGDELEDPGKGPNRAIRSLRGVLVRGFRWVWTQV